MSANSRGIAPREHFVTPDLQAPRILRGAIDRLPAGPIEVHLEAGGGGDHAARRRRRNLVGEGILLAEPIGFGKDHHLGEVGPHLVTRVHGGRDDLAVPWAGEGNHMLLSVHGHFYSPKRGHGAPRVDKSAGQGPA